MHVTSLLVSPLRKLAFSNTKQVKSFKAEAKSQQTAIPVRVRPSSARLPTWAPRQPAREDGSRPGPPPAAATKSFAATANHKLTVLEIPSFDQFSWLLPPPGSPLSCAVVWPVLKDITILEESHANPSPGSGLPLGKGGG